LLTAAGVLKGGSGFRGEEACPHTEGMKMLVVVEEKGWENDVSKTQLPPALD
jgi:hypothetical protein